jgi:hypothetical protein
MPDEKKTTTNDYKVATTADKAKIFIIRNVLKPLTDFRDRIAPDGIIATAARECPSARNLSVCPDDRGHCYPLKNERQPDITPPADIPGRPEVPGRG